MSKYQLKITGLSDDIVSFEGSINDEIYPGDDRCKLFLPNGEEIEVFYDKDGIWRIDATKISFGYEFTNGDIEAVTNDVLIFHSPIKYIAYKSDNRRGIVGEITLSDEEKKIFDQLDELFTDSDFEYDGNEELVKAIIAGKFTV